MEEPLRHEHLGLVHDGRRTAQHSLYARRRTGRELLGRRSSWRESVREFNGRCRRDDGDIQVHFQTVHHDLWDSDMPSPPTLVDIRQGGRTIPALASIGKTGYMFILNRET